MGRLRVIQWTTGKVGTQALRAILDDPRLELVGVFAHGADKIGQDAGALCDRPATGICATADVDALIATGADAVVYTPFTADLDQLCRLLEAGVDVISTNLLLNCGGVVGETRERIAKACDAGDSSLYITGVSPGWITAMAAGLTGVCRQVQSVTIAESADVSNYASKETWDALGLGRMAADEAVVARAKASMVSFRDAATRLAESLGLTLDSLDFEIEHASVTADIDLGFMALPKGSLGALRAAWVGKVGGEEAIRVSVAWYLTPHLAEGWEFDDEHHKIDIKGEPDVQTRIKFVAPQWSGSDWSILTALPAVSAVPAVVAARPGILGLNDIALVSAPAGAWRAA